MNVSGSPFATRDRESLRKRSSGSSRNSASSTRATRSAPASASLSASSPSKPTVVTSQSRARPAPEACSHSRFLERARPAPESIDRPPRKADQKERAARKRLSITYEGGGADRRLFAR